PAPLSYASLEKGSRKVRAALIGDDVRLTVLDGKILKIGRDPSRATALLKDPQVSGLHASLRLQNGLLHVRDEGSSAGTRLESVRLEPGEWQELKEGDELELGPIHLKVSLIDQ
ncbi:MAG: FHA domain-containing protein, partial [Polyangiaceae bacterium]|nr:FHA domain-containing protein [Polyangiaceae bacterium]